MRIRKTLKTGEGDRERTYTLIDGGVASDGCTVMFRTHHRQAYYWHRRCQSWGWDYPPGLHVLEYFRLICERLCITSGEVHTDHIGDANTAVITINGILPAVDELLQFCSEFPDFKVRYGKIAPYRGGHPGEWVQITGDVSIYIPDPHTKPPRKQSSRPKKHGVTRQGVSLPSGTSL